MGLTMKERKAITRELSDRYKKATKKQKGVILNQFTALTGYNRAYASYLLSSHGKTLRVTRNKVIRADVKINAKRQKKRHYDDSVKSILTKIWIIYSYPCGKRLKPLLGEAVARLKGFGEISIAKDTEERLSKISASTIDRLLREEKKKYELKGRSHTKPGTLLKSQIPIRTFSEWDEQRPGFIEVDLVGHEGGDPI